MRRRWGSRGRRSRITMHPAHRESSVNRASLPYPEPMRRRGRPPYPDVLTPRQWEVLALIREGLTDREIALRLGISLDGVKFHVSEILGKLGVSNRNEAARWAGERVASPTACLARAPRRGGAGAVVAQCPLPRTLHHLKLRAGGTPPGAPRQGALRSLHPLRRGPSSGAGIQELPYRSAGGGSPHADPVRHRDQCAWRAGL